MKNLIVNKQLIHSYFIILISSPVIAYILYPFIGWGYANVMGLGLILLLITVWLISFPKKILIPHFLYLLLILFIYHSIWDIVNGTIAEKGVFSYLIKNTWLHMFFGILFVYNTSFSDKLIRHIIWGIKITIIAAFIATFIQTAINAAFLMPTDLFEEEILYYYKVGSIYEIRSHSIFHYCSSNEIGLSFIPLISIFTGYHIYNNISLKKYVVFLIMGAFVCFATNGKYMQIGFLLVLFQYIFANQKNILANATKLIIALCILLILYGLFIIFILDYNLNHYLEQRIFTSGESRILALEAFLKFFPDNVWFGTGKHLTYEIISWLRGRSSQIHVAYFAYPVSYGLFGSIFLFSLWGAILRYLYITAKINSFYGAFFTFVMFLFANSVMVDYSFFSYGIMLSFVFDKYFRDLNTNVCFQKTLNNG